ncbi:TetR/AcrR family transcriptional regulator [Microbacterium terricola]|uniref:TetR family transcriptional regulator n=1 Tax=Microbacterium terricola TaxID=344163 RepID=A0ABM8E298_9MICO|nr:TetR/AcrR family transcriptional regulator [Microbacterium terricola]UYK40366.1 TetR/AcrR family transcriptional regulator [Microbacterium terricola]BDV31919.1 TetR family transcriptional regulator [Microbacterium terricola]
MAHTGYPKGQARREEILTAAVRAFANAGYSGASILEIAAACNITRAGLMHHFRSKEELLIAVLERRESLDREVFRTHDSRRPDGLGVLRGMVALARHNETVPGLVQLYVVVSAESTSPDHPAHDYMHENYRRVRSGIAWALRGAQRAGILAPGIDPALGAVRLLALEEGLQRQWLDDPDGISLAGTLEATVSEMLTVPLWSADEG